MVYAIYGGWLHKEVSAFQWNELITTDNEFRANVIRLMDEEIVEKFDRREGDAKSFYAEPDDLTVPQEATA